MFEHIKNLLNQKYSLDLFCTNRQKSMLCKDQINPHFLYNTLDSIRGLALMQNSLEIANLLKSLSNIFRYSISNKQDVVTLTEELNHLNNYLTIQQYRFQDKFEFVTEFDEPPERFLTCQIPKLTVQPIVENAIFHGLETKRGRGIIHFYIYRTASRLIIEIKDNGNGMDDETLRRLNEKLNSPADPNASPVRSPQKHCPAECKSENSALLRGRLWTYYLQHIERGNHCTDPAPLSPLLPRRKNTAESIMFCGVFEFKFYLDDTVLKVLYHNIVVVNAFRQANQDTGLFAVYGVKYVMPGSGMKADHRSL